MPIVALGLIHFLRARSATLLGCPIEPVAIAELITEGMFWTSPRKPCRRPRANKENVL